MYGDMYGNIVGDGTLWRGTLRRGWDIVATLPNQNKNILKAKNNPPNTENNNWKETWCIVLLYG